MSTENQLTYIPWVDSDRFTSKIILGDSGIYYNLQIEYNVRGSHWSVTITSEDNVVLIQNRKLIIGVDLFENCYSNLKPNCYLIPLTDDDIITTITRDNMINGNVKLFHILNINILV